MQVFCKLEMETIYLFSLGTKDTIVSAFLTPKISDGARCSFRIFNWFGIYHLYFLCVLAMDNLWFVAKSCRHWSTLATFRLVLCMGDIILFTTSMLMLLMELGPSGFGCSPAQISIWLLCFSINHSLVSRIWNQIEQYKNLKRIKFIISQNISPPFPFVSQSCFNVSQLPL